MLRHSQYWSLKSSVTGKSKKYFAQQLIEIGAQIQVERRLMLRQELVDDQTKTSAVGFLDAAVLAAAAESVVGSACQMGRPAATDAGKIQTETGSALGLIEYSEERLVEVEIDHGVKADLEALESTCQLCSAFAGIAALQMILVLWDPWSLFLECHLRPL